jgi:hypothetical protein
MQELYNALGAKFLVDSKFKVQVETSAELYDPANRLPEEFIKESLQQGMLQSMAAELHSRFKKEIKVTQYPIGGETHELSLFAFTPTEFKLAVEWIISQMPESTMQRIRSTGPV